MCCPPRSGRERQRPCWSASAALRGCFWRPRRSSKRCWAEAARYLHVTTELARVYLEDKSQGLKRVYDTDSAVELFRPKFLGRKTEAVCLLLLDSRGRLLYNDILSEGSVSAVPIYIRRLLQLCILYDAQHVILAHNHPSGNAAASRNDITATHQVEMALESIDATLNDHIIFAGEDYNSFARSGWLNTVKEDVRAYRRQETENARQKERELLKAPGFAPWPRGKGEKEGPSALWRAASAVFLKMSFFSIDKRGPAV